MIKDRSWKKADYPNRKPAWQKNRIKCKEKPSQIERVLASLDWENLATLGQEEK